MVERNSYKGFSFFSGLPERCVYHYLLFDVPFTYCLCLAISSADKISYDSMAIFHHNFIICFTFFISVNNYFSRWRVSCQLGFFCLALFITRSTLASGIKYIFIQPVAESVIACK